MGPDNTPHFLGSLEMVHRHTHGLHKAEEPIARVESIMDINMWHDVAKCVRFLSTYLPGVTDTQQSEEQIIDSARLATAGHYDTDVAEMYGISRSVVRTNRHRVSIACALAFPEIADIEEANEIARVANNVENIYRVSDIYSAAKRLDRYMHSSTLPMEDILAQPHLHFFLQLFTNGYGLADIEDWFGFTVPQASRHKTSEAFINWLCYEGDSPTGLHTYLKKMVFQKWVMLEENWNDRHFTEEEYDQTMEELNARGGNEYVYSLRKYAYFRELVNANPELFLPNISLEVSPFSGLSPATQYFIASYAAGYQTKDLAGPLLDLTAYSPKTIAMALSAGIRFTENILLAQDKRGGLSRKVSMSRAKELKSLFAQLPYLIHSSMT